MYEPAPPEARREMLSMYDFSPDDRRRVSRAIKPLTLTGLHALSTALGGEPQGRLALMQALEQLICRTCGRRFDEPCRCREDALR